MDGYLQVGVALDDRWQELDVVVDDAGGWQHQVLDGCRSGTWRFVP